MCRTVAVAAMRAGDLLAADAAIAADDAICESSGQPRQLDTWAQVIRLQVTLTFWTRLRRCPVFVRCCLSSNAAVPGA